MQYILRHPPNSKRLSLKVEYPNRVIVSAPKRFPKRIIDRFVEEHQSWISTQVRKIAAQHQQVETDNQLMIFGKKYQKTCNFNNNQRQGIFILQDQLQINFPDSILKKNINKEIKLFLKTTARTYLYKKTPLLAKKLKLSYSSLTLREQKSRWGSCSSKDSINLNWRLVHYPPAVIDYVIIHELAHLIHRNHSRYFWKMVAEHDPEYKEHRKYLKKYGVTNFES